MYSATVRQGNTLADRLRAGPFLEAFRAKAPFEELLAGIPVLVILDPDCALWGAARVAGEIARGP